MALTLALEIDDRAYPQEKITACCGSQSITPQYVAYRTQVIVRCDSERNSFALRTAEFDHNNWTDLAGKAQSPRAIFLVGQQNRG